MAAVDRLRGPGATHPPLCPAHRHWFIPTSEGEHGSHLMLVEGHSVIDVEQAVVDPEPFAATWLWREHRTPRTGPPRTSGSRSASLPRSPSTAVRRC
jgi:hypothetical protein